MSVPPSNRLFGHERTVQTLQESILGSRSMPTWIFGGPFGVGKFTKGKQLAEHICLTRGQVLPGAVVNQPDVART